MEDNQNNNTNDFQPTKELGDLAKYAAKNAFGVKKMWTSAKKSTRLDDVIIGAMFDGTWPKKSDYIRLLSKCVSMIRQKKVRLKRLPDTLPNRDVMESLENGLEEDIVLYKKAITELCRMPDIPLKTASAKPKKHNSNTFKRSSILTKREDFRTSSYYRQISSNNGTLYNLSPPSSDFDYGLTDT